MFTVGLSVVLVLIGVYFFTAQDIIIFLLEILIVAEIVRMLANFITDKNHKINIRYAIDGSIIYVLRELYITLTAFQTNPELWTQILVYMCVILAFIGARSVTIKQYDLIVNGEAENLK